MIRKGTGFTNVNKILQANRGNRLGATVSQGISSEGQGVQTGIQQARDKFDEEAEKGRLDNQESKDKRQQVLGRFDQSQYKPDESQFAVSSGLSSQFQTKKGTIDQQRSQYEAQRQAQQKQIQDKMTADQAKLAQLKTEASRTQEVLGATPYSNQRAGAGFSNEYDSARIAAGVARKQAQKYEQGLASLGRINSTLQKDLANKSASFDAQSQGLQDEYAKQTEAEKNAWRQSQIDANMAANLPSEQELREFSKYRTGTYAGPRELVDSGALFSQAQQTEQLGDLARSSGGRQELLRKFVGGKDYTAGQRKLDQTILGQDTGTELGQAARSVRDSLSDVERANQIAAEQAKEYTGRASEFGAETRKLIEGVSTPLVGQAEQRMAELQGQETSRTAASQRLKEVLSGQGQYKDLDQLARAGIALQDAQNLGFLNNDEVQKLTATGGLVSRGMQAGLDVNSLLAERLKDTAGVGLNRASAATEAQRASLAALDRLSGKMESESEFGNAGKYQAGKSSFDIGSLEEYIAKTEAEKAAKDPGYAQAVEKQKADYAALFASGALGQAQGALQNQWAAADAVTGNLGNPLAMQGDLAKVGADSIAQGINSSADMAIGTAGTTANAQNQAIQGILKLAGGNSKTAQQLMKAQQMYNDLQNKGLELGSNVSRDLSGSFSQAGEGISDLASGNISSGVNNLVKSLTSTPYNTVKNVASGASKAISTALGGGKTGNWATEKLNLRDASGKKVKVGAFANASSDDILNQMLSNDMLSRYNQYFRGSSEGSKITKKMTDYYNKALAREAKYKVSDETQKTDISYDPKDVESFMGRIKASSYNYKDEVKDSPLASKNREIGVMAQDLEKSKLGKEAVKETSMGKVVDYDNLGPKMLASIANLNERLKKMEEPK